MKRVLILCIGVFLLSCTACVSADIDEKTTENDCNQQVDVSIDVSSGLSNPKQSTEQGTIRLVKENEGTLSEINYFVLFQDSNKNLILFNEKGFSQGFDKWLNQTVVISGYRDIGIIGYKRQEKSGFFVLNIKNGEKK
jgi:hypothetical protein